MKEKIVELFEILHKGKKAGSNPALWDGIFCLIVETIYSQLPGSREIQVTLCTSDMDGMEGPEQAHYDVVSLSLVDGGRLLTATIPVPLLKCGTVVSLVKMGAKVVPRGDSRAFSRSCSREVEFKLWEEVHDLLLSPEVTISWAVNRHLTEQALDENQFTLISGDFGHSAYTGQFFKNT